MPPTPPTPLTPLTRHRRHAPLSLPSPPHPTMNDVGQRGGPGPAPRMPCGGGGAEEVSVEAMLATSVSPNVPARPARSGRPGMAGGEGESSSKKEYGSGRSGGKRTLESRRTLDSRRHGTAGSDIKFTKEEVVVSPRNEDNGGPNSNLSALASILRERARGREDQGVGEGRRERCVAFGRANAVCMFHFIFFVIQLPSPLCISVCWVGNQMGRRTADPSAVWTRWTMVWNRLRIWRRKYSTTSSALYDGVKT